MQKIGAGHKTVHEINPWWGPQIGVLYAMNKYQSDVDLARTDQLAAVVVVCAGWCLWGVECVGDDLCFV